MKLLNAGDADFGSQLVQLLDRQTDEQNDVLARVHAIIDDVRQRGDAAVLDYTRQFDYADIDAMASLQVSQTALQQAKSAIADDLREALERAAQRVRDYHSHQGVKAWQFTEADGTKLGQHVIALDRVGVYVPGGKAAYPSSVIMTAVPAKVAGVREVIMVAPAVGGEVPQAVLAAAAIAGVDKVFTVGGAQAIAALAYGTETIPQVDKIVGPGNQYVAAAKQIVFGQVGIDMIAGPSEVLIICDKEANPDWVAMDMFAQAEHDEMAQAVVVSDSQEMLDAVQSSIEKLLPKMPRADIIQKSLDDHGALIKVHDLNEAVVVSNRVAPEHLQLMVADAEVLLAQVRHAGAIFCGYYSAESLGDYCAGPSHVLPTSGTARFSSPLSVYDFQKRISVIYASAKGGQSMAAIAATIADSEQLSAHAQSARYRM